MKWLTDVFNEPAQQAQLIAIVFSAVVALSVLLVNQWFLTRRARCDLYIKKIEELYIAIADYEDAGYDFMSFSCTESNQFEMDSVIQKFNRVTDALQKIDMFMSLYFLEVPFDVSDYEDPHREVYLLYCDEIESDLSMDSERIKAFETIMQQSLELKAIAKSLMNKHKH